jgi:protein-S-isoprenylcysteine O-methyltransferase Ste14
MLFWATPDMTAGHLLFALLNTVYILIGAHLEEKDLIDLFGERYQRYQRSVAMLIPLTKRKTGPEPNERK